MTRREFLGFFIVGGFIGLLNRKLKLQEKAKKAMFWKKVK